MNQDYKYISHEAALFYEDWIVCQKIVWFKLM
jgi:hypothetical protein